MIFIRDILYKFFLNKKICPFCNKSYSSKSILCPKCTSIIESANKQEFCRKCGKFIIKDLIKNDSSEIDSFLINNTCHVCQSSTRNVQHYFMARGVTLYEGIIKENLYKFKYHGQRSLAAVMARLMVEKALTLPEYCYIDCIVSVPISKEKLLTRRYNQAYLLAKEIGKLMSLPVISDNLVRIINTPAQSKLSKEAREENQDGAFDVLKAEEFLGKKVLLVDDILTTGSTASECSKVLKKKGASEVLVLTLVTGKTSWNGGKRNGYPEL